jgi:methionyl aminopeptidase
MAKIPLITPAEGDLAYAAAQCVVEAHRRVAAFLKVGVTLPQIDAFVARQLSDLNCRSCFLGYSVPGSPKFPSHACLSVNECVVHGTAGYYTAPMKEGDVLKIDIGVWHKGWIGDAAWTYCFARQSPQVKKLMDCGKESLRRGVLELRPGNMYIHWAQAVQRHVENECRFHLIRGLGGHGIGRKLHGPPFVSNVVPTYAGEWPDAMLKCEPGTLLAVEPMIAVGTGEVAQKAKTWPVFSADGSLAVHYEHDVLITEKGPRSLTEGLEQLPDVVG